MQSGASSTKGNEQEATHAKGYAVNLEIELQMVCDGILALMDESLILSASTEEPRDFRYEITKRVEEIPQIMVPVVRPYPDCTDITYTNPTVQTVL